MQKILSILNMNLQSKYYQNKAIKKDKGMKVFYINLEKRKDRKDHMEKMLSKLNLDYERFPAICPTIDEIKFGKYKKFYDKACERIKSFADTERQYPRAIGVFGCYLSHFMIHESQASHNKPYIIIEDDASISKDTFTKLNKITCSNNFEDWDIIRSVWEQKVFGVKHLDKDTFTFKGVHEDSKFSKTCKTHNFFGGSHFCVFKNSQKILKYLYSENLMATDSLYSTCKLNVYCSKELSQIAGYSSDIPKIK